MTLVSIMAIMEMRRRWDGVNLLCASQILKFIDLMWRRLWELHVAQVEVR